MQSVLGFPRKHIWKNSDPCHVCGVDDDVGVCVGGVVISDVVLGCGFGEGGRDGVLFEILLFLPSLYYF